MATINNCASRVAFNSETCRFPRLPTVEQRVRLSQKPFCTSIPSVSTCTQSVTLTASAVASPPALGPDMYVLELAESFQEAQKPLNSEAAATLLEKLGEEASETALSHSWPTTKQEAYRFTNLRNLKSASIVPSAAAIPGDQLANHDDQVRLSLLALKEADGSRIVLVDGVFNSQLSSLEDIPEGIVVSNLGQLSEPLIQKYVAPHLGSSSSKSQQSDLFSSLNAIGTPDLAVIIAPQGVKSLKPIHVVYVSSGSGSELVMASCPRLLVVVEKEAEVHLVEEYVGFQAGYWTNAVTEIFIGQEGRVGHGYVQSQNKEAFHFKKTFVSQAEKSFYSLVEVSLGSQLSRHNFSLQQLGPDTETAVSTFTLSGKDQLQDLHSALVLDFPRGQTRQLHKCIVTHEKGQAVFDGNVKVNRLAQQTDAGQLSRSLLLVPRGTINVKPNLQIIADDVKCTHGAAISDLEDEQLFYFRARGIDELAARSALVFSFGAEVIGKLPYSDLIKRIEETVKSTLLKEGAMDASTAGDLGKF